MNLYKIKIDFTQKEGHIIGKSINDALLRAQEKYNYPIIGIWLIEEGVE